MNKQINGKIYKIYAVGFEHEMVYIGSTKIKNFNDRFYHHKSTSKSGSNSTTCRTIFEKYGIENCTIELIENSNFNSIYEMRKREAHYIKLHNNAVNKNMPSRTPKEFYDAYYIKYKEELTLKKKVPHKCECGGAYTYVNKSQHEKTKKHIKFINEKSSIELMFPFGN